ncbi:MAG: hypothetical protein IJH60_07475, partial [Eubacterium sp.]|nr:hypothetical protein [Eubacterium sp.]
MGKLLNQIHQANDIKKIPVEEYETLATEIRTFILKNVSKTGG